MGRALELAKIAASAEEVPVGAVLVRGTEVLAEAHNRTVADADATAHAELLTIRSASMLQGDWRLLDTTLYVTLEPCAMCAGAMVHARIKRCIYGAIEPKAGAIESSQQFFQQPYLNHRVVSIGQVLVAPCREKIQNFFQQKRK